MATTSSRKKRGGRNHPCEPVFTAPHLSPEIIVEIISRLPVKSLCRFRCVSKLWLSTISCPKFAKTHLDLAFQNNTQKQVLISWAGGEVCSIDWESINADDVISKGLVAVELDNPLKDNPCLLNVFHIFSSSHGLVFIVDGDKETFLLINPCTGESRKIPVRSQKYRFWHYIVYGFGYASKTDDYKLVTIDGENISMYSLRSGTWSESTPQMPYQLFCSASGVPVNGALHWLCCRTLSVEMDCVVVCFDLNENTIREMPGPAFDYDIVYNLTLGVINGCLCAHYTGEDEDDDAFWVMREYNNGESWTKISSSYVPLDTLGLAENRVNIWNGDRKIVLCNFRNDTHGIPTEGGFRVVTYVESLISPNHYVGEVSESS